mmetsp:Transcript_3495/g.5450  ORF Transcript_3495/g.5450 Transcript_3495/m.5450 type:complete len:453 (-) Transcript_3495:137-1495(-)
MLAKYSDIAHCSKGFECFQDVVFLHTPRVATGEALAALNQDAHYVRKASAKRLYFPARAICLLQPHRGKVVLPSGNKDLEMMWSFMAKELGLDENDQVIWFSTNGDGSLESDLYRDVNAMSKLVNSNLPVIPHGVRPEYESWTQECGLRFLCDTAEWKSEFGFKSIFHSIPDKNAVSTIDRVLPDVPRARGYLCRNPDELIMAAHYLKEEGIVEVVIKPVTGSDGDGIEFCTIWDDFSQYKFVMGDVLLEEKLNVDLNPDGTVLSVVTHFYGEKLFGKCCDQLIGDVANFMGTVCPSNAPGDLCAQCEEIALDIIGAIHPQGPGGFDFLFVGGKPFVVDNNSGRFNAGQYPKAFHMQYASPETAFISFKHTPQVSLSQMWDTLQEERMQFRPICPRSSTVMDYGDDNSLYSAGSYGVFPLVHLPQVYGVYIVIASTFEECMSLKQKFLEFNF